MKNTKKIISFLINENGFTWDMGNRYIASNTKLPDGSWVNNNGHVWETGSPKCMAHPKAPFLNINTGEHSGKWVHFSKEEFDELLCEKEKVNWIVPGPWCDKVLQFALLS